MNMKKLSDWAAEFPLTEVERRDLRKYEMSIASMEQDVARGRDNGFITGEEAVDFMKRIEDVCSELEYLSTMFKAVLARREYLRNKDKKGE